MSDSNVHVGTHPSGHPNKTAVNAENPIFGRPADPIPAVSIQQAAVVQSEKHPRETVQSPLINELAVSPVGPSVGDLGAMQAAGEKQPNAAEFENEANAFDTKDGSGSEREGWDTGFAQDGDPYGIGAEYVSQSPNPNAAPFSATPSA
jgi:hypothetical protein